MQLELRNKGSRTMIDVMDLREIVYLEIEGIVIDQGRCTVEVSFYHNLLKKHVASASIMFVCRSKGEWMTSFEIREGESVILRDIFSDSLHKYIEKVFGDFFL